MKIITLMRHGKSSWKYDVPDHKRPLKSRGKNDARLVAEEFAKHNLPVEQLFSSPAKRAHATCEIFTKYTNYDMSKVKIIDELYDFGGENVISFIKSLNNNLDSVMIFGHNHAFTSISNIFGSTFTDNLPTSGLVRIEFEIERWQDLKKGHTKLLIIPKELR